MKDGKRGGNWGEGEAYEKLSLCILCVFFSPKCRTGLLYDFELRLLILRGTLGNPKQIFSAALHSLSTGSGSGLMLQGI